ncbi:Rne/Rng family ribonuclease [uncultured Propionibacterium sp.]|uniref:Rne/Rng family ribonuclease n=1 Tax=uncultured Propionibacterium sp. TaxID=218066 RepID=UPI00292D2B22|nr:Rne/Rng family ribonuclease [uncultured Propionibacterium sp.]
MLDDATSEASETADDDLPCPPRGRRARTRPAGPPQADPIVAPESEEPHPETAGAVTGEAGEPPAGQSGSEQSDPVAAAIAAVMNEVAAERAAEQAGLEGLPEPAEKPVRRRRPAPGDGEDGGSAAGQVDALLSEAERAAVGKGRGDTRGADEEDLDKQAVLDSLTAAIAGGEAPAEVPGGPAEENGLPAAEERDGSARGGDDGAEAEPATHRRRRRGGRRRHRGSEPGENEDGVESESPEPGGKPGEDESGGSERGEGGQGQNRRRRRRRRRGEDVGGSDDDPSDVVVRVREPRHSAVDEVTGIEGSTRLEAKRQRRKEGRAAGRRRAPILSEAEFLARRESVNRKMIIRQREEYTQLAVLEDDVLVEHYVDRKASTSLIGNIYLGKVQNVLPSMEAAFIDIGRGRNAVLYAGEVNWDAAPDKNAPHAIETALEPGQTVLVQVSKDPIGAKGARLTAHISLPGRYVVYSPDGHLSGISRKLPDTERRRLKEIINEVVDESSSVIVRTAAEGVSADDLRHDVDRLKAQWGVIERKVATGNAPQQLYAEPDLTLRIVRDLFTEDFSELVIAGDGGPSDAFDTIDAYVEHVAPSLRDRLQRWNDEQGDPFTTYRVDEQISKALERKVFLPSGGSLVIDRTEAMTVIDVNTGKFTGSGGNLEETVTKNNLEAAEEIVRQLRLRDLGGIVVVDFIDMVLPANRELLLRRLVECLERDRTRHQVSEVTSLGLVQMTRKRIGTGLAEAFTVECDACGGRGYIRHDEPVASQAPADGGERHRRGRRGGRRKGS